MDKTLHGHNDGIATTSIDNVAGPHVHPFITEEQVRKIVHEEVAKALADLKPQLAQEVQREMMKQVRISRGVTKAGDL